MSSVEHNGLFAGLRAPHEIIFGSGQRQSLPAVLQKLGGRAFFCVDPFMASHPEVEALISKVTASGIALKVFSDIIPELPLENVDSAVESAERHNADVVVAIGGGSSIDMAKLVACLLAHPGDVRDYIGEFAVPGPVAPIVAIPTTAGTGSEVTPVAVITDTGEGIKAGISSPHLIPSVALCDPELTLTCPAGVTAASGTDALTHCIESYTAVKKRSRTDLMGSNIFVGRSELTGTLARAGIEAIVKGLHRAYEDSDCLTAREEVMYGSLLGGLAFGTAGNAAAHALQYPIGAQTNTPHGVGVGLLIPYVMEYNLPERQAEFAEISRVIRSSIDHEEAANRLPSEQDSDGAAAAPRLVQEFLKQLGIPTTLGEIGFDSSMIGWAAERGVAAKRLCENNPVPLDAEGAELILQSAVAGQLRSA